MGAVARGSKTTMATGSLGEDMRAAAQASHPAAFARVGDDWRAVAQAPHPTAFARAAKDMRAVDTAWCGRRKIAGVCTGLPDKQGEVR